jgi:sec-independent protein translocase protein TatA
MAATVEVRAPVARRNVGSLSPWHLILLLAIVLLVVGPGRLPETGAAIGRALRDFKSALAGSTDEPAGHDGTENVVTRASGSSAAAPADPLAIRPPGEGHDVGGAP